MRTSGQWVLAPTGLSRAAAGGALYSLPLISSAAPAARIVLQTHVNIYTCISPSSVNVCINSLMEHLLVYGYICIYIYV